MEAAAQSRSVAGTSARAGLMTKPKRNNLTLKLKYKVIKETEKEPKISVCKLTELFSCGKTQISSILKDKDRIVELYETQNASDQKCHKRNRESKYSVFCSKPVPV